MTDGPTIVVHEKRVGSGVGLGAIILGVLGIVFGIVFVPFGLIFSVVALFKSQIALGIVGLLTNLFALASSVVFWTLFGLSAGFTVYTW